MPMVLKISTCAAIFATLFSLTLQAELPPDFKICKRSDKNLNECFREAIQDALPKFRNGIKELGVPPLEPVVIPEVKIAEGTSAVRFSQFYKNFKIHNIANSIIKEAVMKFEENKATFDVYSYVDDIVFDSDYEVNGRVLLFPITGNGKCLITLKNVESHMHLDAEEILKKNVKYFNVTGITVKANISKLVLQFDNLFNGNKELGDNINKVLNDNWKELYNDLGRNYEELFESVYINYINKVFSKVSSDILSPP